MSDTTQICDLDAAIEHLGATAFAKIDQFEAVARHWKQRADELTEQRDALLAALKEIRAEADQHQDGAPDASAAARAMTRIYGTANDGIVLVEGQP